MFTGEFLLSKYLNDKPLRKVLYMVLAAITLMISGRSGILHSRSIKTYGQAHFVCFVGGLSLLLFSVFYLIIDVWGYKKWAFFL